MLIHREFSIPYPAKLIIEKDKIKTENSNRAMMIGKINFNSYEPYPKNPKIAKVFKEIGLADELGSGVRNMVKYTKIYSGGIPELKEDDIFTTIIPLESGNNFTEKLTQIQESILDLISKKTDITQMEIVTKLNLSRQTIATNLKYLKENNIIERRGSDKKGYWKIKK